MDWSYIQLANTAVPNTTALIGLLYLFELDLLSKDLLITTLALLYLFHYCDGRSIGIKGITLPQSLLELNYVSFC